MLLPRQGWERRRGTLPAVTRIKRGRGRRALAGGGGGGGRIRRKGVASEGLVNGAALVQKISKCAPLSSRRLGLAVHQRACAAARKRPAITSAVCRVLLRLIHLHPRGARFQKLRVGAHTLLEQAGAARSCAAAAVVYSFPGCTLARRSPRPVFGTRGGGLLQAGTSWACVTLGDELGLCDVGCVVVR